MATKHGMSDTPIWNVWSLMKKRCRDKGDRAFANYGGRGISVDESWLSFENFYNDMGGTYKQGLLLDRIDNNKGYSKENCRWTTRVVQNNNTRRNRFINFSGRRMTLSQWSRELGIKRSTLAQRFYVYGWTIKKCLTYKV